MTSPKNPSEQPAPAEAPDRNMEGAREFINAILFGGSIWPNPWGQDVAAAAYFIHRQRTDAAPAEAGCSACVTCGQPWDGRTFGAEAGSVPLVLPEPVGVFRFWWYDSDNTTSEGHLAYSFKPSDPHSFTRGRKPDDTLPVFATPLSPKQESRAAESEPTAPPMHGYLMHRLLDVQPPKLRKVLVEEIKLYGSNCAKLTTIEAAPVQGAEQSLEEIAEKVYEAMRFEQPQWVPWVRGGNSLAQDHARRAARSIQGTGIEASKAGAPTSK